MTCSVFRTSLIPGTADAKVEAKESFFVRFVGGSSKTAPEVDGSAGSSAALVAADFCVRRKGDEICFHRYSVVEELNPTPFVIILHIFSPIV